MEADRTDSQTRPDLILEDPSGTGRATDDAGEQPVAARTTTSRTGRWAGAIAAGAIIVGLAIRLWFVATPGAATLDADQATTGLMVRDMISGSQFYLYFAGQNYNGALEQYVQTLQYSVLGLPQNGFTLRLVPTAFAGISIWLVYLVGVQVLGDRLRAALAAALFACGPFFLIQKGTSSDGSYASTQALAIFGLYCAFRLRGRSDDSWVWLGLLAFVSGVCVWTGLTAAFLLAPAWLWAASTVRRSWKTLGVAAIAGIIGLLPVLASTFRYGSVPVPRGGQPASTLWERVENLFGLLMREFLGVGLYSGRPGWPVAVQVVVVVAAIAAWVAAVVVRRRGLADLLRLGTGARRPIDVLLVAVPFTWIVHSVSNFGWFGITPRYLFVMFPVLVWLIAAAVPRRPRWGLAVAATIGALWVGTSVQQLVSVSTRVPSVTAADYAAAAGALIATGDVNVYGSYWDVIPLRYYGGDAINPAPLTVGNNFPALRRPVDNSDEFVYVANASDLRSAAGIAAGLRKAGITFTVTRYGGLAVYSNLSAYPKPWTIGLAVDPGP